MVSLWGGREHFITALAGDRSADIWIYFEEWEGAAQTSVGSVATLMEDGDERSAAGERGGESSRERLGIERE